MNEMKISPSLLGCDFLNLKKEIKRLEKEKADYIHIDLMDGHFVPNISLGIDLIKDIKRATKIPLDVHLMFEHPLFFIDKIGELLCGDLESIITIHAECQSNIDECLEKISRLGYKKGIALNPNTEIRRIEKYIRDVDLVLQMTVFPGFGGQELIAEAINKGLGFRIQDSGKNVILAADGGITEDNVGLLKDAGFNMIVVGNTIWKSKNITKTIRSLKNV